MYLEKVQGMVDIIQDKRRKLVATLPNTEENRELPQVGKVYEPGETGIRVKKGYLLLDVINVPKRKFAIQIKDNQTSVSDFLGVHPLVGVVYEVYEKEEFFKVWRIACRRSRWCVTFTVGFSSRWYSISCNQRLCCSIGT